MLMKRLLFTTLVGVLFLFSGQVNVWADEAQDVADKAKAEIKKDPVESIYNLQTAAEDAKPARGKADSAAG